MSITISPPQRPRHYCNNCSNHTWHKLLFETSTAEPLDEDYPDTSIVETWKVFQCLGCENLSLLTSVDYPWEEVATQSYYPERKATARAVKSYKNLPERLTGLYREVIAAFNRDSLLLCTAGLRALLEGICDERGITEGPNSQGAMSKSLEGKINGLSSVVPSGIVAHLHGFRFLGNRALHELEAPKRDDLALAIAVVEDVLNVVYDLNYQSERFFKSATRKKGDQDPEEDIPF